MEKRAESARFEATAGVEMARAGKKRFLQTLALGTGLAVVLVSAPASAGFFDRLFGSIGRAIERPAPAPSSDPFTSLLGGGGDSHVRAENSGPAKAFCVR